MDGGKTQERPFEQRLAAGTRIEPRELVEAHLAAVRVGSDHVPRRLTCPISATGWHAASLPRNRRR